MDLAHRILSKGSRILNCTVFLRNKHKNEQRFFTDLPGRLVTDLNGTDRCCRNVGEAQQGLPGVLKSDLQFSSQSGAMCHGRPWRCYQWHGNPYINQVPLVIECFIHVCFFFFNALGIYFY